MNPPPDIVLTSVQVGPSNFVLEIGQTQQLAANARYSDGRTEQGVSATWRSSDPAVAAVSPSGLVTAIAEGGATLTATVGERSGNASVTVTQAFCAESRELTLETGEHATVGTDDCLLIVADAAGAYYRIGVTRPTAVENPADVRTVVVESRVAGADARPEAPVSSESGAPSEIRRPADGFDGSRLSEDLRILQATRRAHGRVMEESRSDPSLDRRFLLRELGLEPDRDLAPPPSRREINTSFTCGGSRDPHLLIGYNDHISVYQDSVLWAKGRMSERTASELTGYYETAVQPMLDEYFGEASDLDGNGRIVVTTAPTIGDSISGLVWTGHFFDRAACSGSNEGEYIFLNDSLVNVLDNPSPGWFILGTLAHEAQHVVALYGRLATDQGLHPNWIEEGRAELAGELSGRFQWAYEGGPSPTERVDADMLLNHLCQPDCAFRRESYSVVTQLANLIVHLSTHPNSLVVNPSGANEFHSIYASGWHFTRALVDGYGRASEGLGGEFAKRLAGGDIPTGVPGLEAVTGKNYRTLLEEIVAGMAFNGTPGISPAPSISSYDLTSVTKIFSSPAVLVTSGTYPWPLTASGEVSNHVPFTNRRIEGPTGPSGFRFHDFRASAANQAINVRVTAPSPATVVVARLR